MKAGKVFLVGAGPGAIDLVTIRAADAIARADVIIHDALANHDLLKLGSPRAIRIDAGKRGGTRRGMTQAALNAMLVEHARHGRTVVRLKGGDPFIFGRGGEEAEALVRAGIEFEVVPGVTSAIAAPAYAGIPLTHRDLGSFVAFATGARNTKDGDSHALERLAGAAQAERGTIVVLMAVARMRMTMKRLIDGGLAPSTPAAAIRWGTTASQRTVAGTLGTIAARCEREKLGAPAVIVVGNVASLARTLGWTGSMPLFGVRIGITRASARSGDFARALRRLGAEVVEFATIETHPPRSWRAADIAIARASSFDWIIFTSAQGVESFVARIRETGRDIRAIGGAKIAAIGPATAARLGEYAIKVDAIPREYRAEAIISGIGASSIKAARFLIPRAQVAREVLPAMLRNAGAREVVVAPVYRTTAPPKSSARAITKLIRDGALDLVTFTSSSTARNFAAMIGTDATRVPAAAIGPITSATARELGFRVAVEAKDYTTDGLTHAIVKYFAARRRKRR